MNDESPRLLIVDDDAPILRATARWFRSRGYEVMLSRTGMGAMASVEPVWCAVFDLDLPDGCGLDHAENLLQAAIAQEVVFFSATRDPELIKRARQLGVFVAKAEGIDKLWIAVESLRQRSQSMVVGLETPVEIRYLA